MDIILWAVLIVVFVIVELCTFQLVSIWLAVASLITVLCAVCFENLSLLGQAAIFVISALILVIATLPLIKKRLNKAHIATNSELEIGKNAIVIEEINSALGTGRVTLNGVDWSAASVDDSVITKGCTVVVNEIKGTKLIVKMN